MNSELETTLKSYSLYHNLYSLVTETSEQKFNQTNAQKPMKILKRKLCRDLLPANLIL